MDFTLNDAQRQLQLTLRRFVEREVMPVASEYEHADAYPDSIVTADGGEYRKNSATRQCGSKGNEDAITS